MRRIRIRELIHRASKDFELAKGMMQIKDYVVATLLYNKAIEKMLKALFISKTKREPPANASIEYLAKATGMPEEVSMYIKSMQESEEINMGPADFVDLAHPEDIDAGAARRAFYMDGLAKRLLDYVSAYTKI